MVTNKGRKISGGKYIRNRKKKSSEIHGQKRRVKLGEQKTKQLRTRGGHKKTVMLTGKFVNVALKDKTKKRVEIKNVLETPSDRFLARQNIITKGTILDTELGKVKVTNRPTQEAAINGVLVE